MGVISWFFGCEECKCKGRSAHFQVKVLSGTYLLFLEWRLFNIIVTIFRLDIFDSGHGRGWHVVASFLKNNVLINLLRASACIYYRASIVLSFNCPAYLFAQELR
jgi:hypothetical protein